MRGSPLLRLILVAAALALLAVPVWRLTLQSPPPSKISPKPAATTEDLADYRIVLTASSPARLQAMAANRPSASTPKAAQTLDTLFSMNPREPEDIAVFADFNERTQPSALRVEVMKGGEVLIEKTFWGTGLIEDVVMIPTK